MNTASRHQDTDQPKRQVVLRAQGVGLAYPGLTLFQDLSFVVPAGLSFVRGGEGRGKTTLLRLMAGELRPTAGRLQLADAGSAPGRDGERIFWSNLPENRDDPQTPRQWLRDWSERFGDWDRDLLDELIQGFELEAHLDKAMFMLSTGSRRKVWLAGAFASGARLTLLEKPFAALDARSRGLLAELLQEAARHQSRAWVVADYEWPAGLASLKLAQRIDLGD